jgi:hypothetical protein
VIRTVSLEVVVLDASVMLDSLITHRAANPIRLRLRHNVVHGPHVFDAEVLAGMLARNYPDVLGLEP